MTKQPQIIKFQAISMQICVPSGWDDKECVDFSEKGNPCGTQSGWHVRKQGSELLGRDPERNPCEQRSGYVHITLDA